MINYKKYIGNYKKSWKIIKQYIYKYNSTTIIKNNHKKTLKFIDFFNKFN